jgi:hypothetical protein
MESEGMLALERPHLSIMSLGESGDNWVLRTACKTQGPFSMTVPREWPFFVWTAIFSCAGERSRSGSVQPFQSWELYLGLGTAATFTAIQSWNGTVEAETMTTQCNLRTKLLSSSPGGD